MPFAALPFPFGSPDANIAFELGPLAVRWYGLAYLVSMVLGWLYTRSIARDERIWTPLKPRITVEQLDDFLIWATVGVVAGGRLGYVFLYDLPRFASEPLDVLRLWSGGMSFHGGFLGVVMATILFCWKHRLSILSLLDVLAAATPIGLFFGRLANFVNGELWGRPSDVPWAMAFPGAGPLPRHPSQLYEAALEGVLLFLLLSLLTHRLGALRYPGLTGGAFVAGYGLSRILVEFVREPDAHIGYLVGPVTMGMLLSLPMVLVGLGAAYLARQRGVPA